MFATQRLTEYRHGDLVFDVIDQGPLQGEVIVLLHGFPQMAASWQSVATLLNNKGYRTIMPNQRGYSVNARPKGVRAYRIDALVSDILVLIRTMNQGAVHLVGHDWGAAVAWALAAKYPEVVRTLTAVSVPHTGAFMESMLKSDQLLKSWYILLFQLPYVAEYLTEYYPNFFVQQLKKSGMTTAQLADYKQHFIKGGAFRYGVNWYRALPLAPIHEIFTKVSVPTTYVWSDADTALGRTGAELCAKYVTGPYRYREIKGASHWLPEECSETIANIILSTTQEEKYAIDA